MAPARVDVPVAGVLLRFVALVGLLMAGPYAYEPLKCRIRLSQMRALLLQGVQNLYGLQ